ncbi:hypothetical protein CDAR_107381 [Caerostris darwini]|uniref:Uncharacterized protein n=1 Tax=Caerostris darwini TaxID=1538125 RepID=A0AAV4NEE4_9ARAC|nr:hypothetical protein CDAR_107381 [Caerostris darwini]
MSPRTVNRLINDLRALTCQPFLSDCQCMTFALAVHSHRRISLSQRAATTTAFHHQIRTLAQGPPFYLERVKSENAAKNEKVGSDTKTPNHTSWAFSAIWAVIYKWLNGDITVRHDTFFLSPSVGGTEKDGPAHPSGRRANGGAATPANQVSR